MAEGMAALQERLEGATAAGFRDRLLDKGLARGLIWRDGALPEDSPSFPVGLTEDLLDYGHTVMAMALRLREKDASPAVLQRAFLVAGESIESAIHRGGGGPDRGFHRVTAAVAFHLARYSARAYSVLPPAAGDDNLAPTEMALVQLLRRKLEDLQAAVSAWLLDPANDDEAIAARLLAESDFDASEAVHIVLTTSFMRGLALFDHALTTGETESATEARAHFVATAEGALELGAVSHWWTATLASNLIDELWNLTFFQGIPLLPDGDDQSRWEALRLDYIQRLRHSERAAIELWPSQLEAAQRAIEPADDLVVALPTSAGKTRIAELCILRALAADKRVVYVTPLRALSAQAERDLAEVFRPLGYSVTTLYGSAGIEQADAETLRTGHIVVSTPEKLDFALRYDTSIVDDVGLIVLDEGHMLGPGEREVRYEALVQRLLRREDSRSRRLVCLSALFPTPEDMKDLVGWIRQDEPGQPVHSTWRPTRQRYGVIRWMLDSARLDIEVEEEHPFVPRFVELRKPPERSRRRKDFPSNKNELTLASAWRFVDQEKNVLIYCSIKRSVEALGKLLLKCIDHQVLAPLRTTNERVRDAMATGVEWLGEQHPAVRCLEYGVALHHGGLPRQFLNDVEYLMRSGDCPVTIASPTLAQGLNLSASVLLVPSIWRSREVIPAAEFANVAGRAGRAFVDVEGLVLKVVWEDDPQKDERAVREWTKLVHEAKVPKVQSGILLLAIAVCKQIARVANVPITEVVDYVTGHIDAWDFHDSAADQVDVTAAEWDRQIASLDSAILALLDVETPVDDVEDALKEVLKGSLFSRGLAHYVGTEQDLFRSFIGARALRIWSETNESQRRGYYAAGVGLSAGGFIDANLEVLAALLLQIETAVAAGDAAATSTAVTEFARVVFQTAPFRAPRQMPTRWEQALSGWMAGLPSADVISMCDDDVEVLQGVFTYRLPWAMEAVRVHAEAVGHGRSSELSGLGALAVEAGASSPSAICLLRSGLRSREAALVAVRSTGASFDDWAGMRKWIGSGVVGSKSKDGAWPTERSRNAWLRFYEDESRTRWSKWARETETIRVEWIGERPQTGTYVILEPRPDAIGSLVLSPSFASLGESDSLLRRPRGDIVSVAVGEVGESLVVEYFGPGQVV